MRRLPNRPLTGGEWGVGDPPWYVLDYIGALLDGNHITDVMGLVATRAPDPACGEAHV